MTAVLAGPGRAGLVGIGMIGGSLAWALKSKGWHVTGHDLDEGSCAVAMNRGFIDAVGIDSSADITFIATPVSSIADEARAVLARGQGYVTDVGSVKQPIVEAIDSPRFVGGHPMAGSELGGLDGANAQLFEGATWVLTPTSTTDDDAYFFVREVVSSLGAIVLTLDAAQHDGIVATISHIPHLAAASLMNLVMQKGRDLEPALRLAAGGFRDMTRVAAGPPALWADITLSNREAIVEGLDDLCATLGSLRQSLATGDLDELKAFLDNASHARDELPTRQGRPTALATLMVQVADRPGAIQEVLDALGSERVNVEDLEINHGLDGRKGTLVVTVARSKVDVATAQLRSRNLSVTTQEL